MYLETWMIVTMGIWWVMSVAHIAYSNRKAGYLDGVNEGSENMLVFLENADIINVAEDGTITAGNKKS